MKERSIRIDALAGMKVMIPSVPNFLTVRITDEHDCGWPTAENKFPIGAFSESVLREIGHEWVEALVETAKARKELAE